MLGKYKSLFSILFITFLSSAVAGWVTRLNISPWYESLNKTGFSPPNWIFGPVWTILYLFMSISIWMVYEHTKKTDTNFSKKILRIYFYHLAINFTWSFIFFNYNFFSKFFLNHLLHITCIINQTQFLRLNARPKLTTKQTIILIIG
jgi:benzodiazapine receptor